MTVGVFDDNAIHTKVTAASYTWVLLLGMFLSTDKNYDYELKVQCTTSLWFDGFTFTKMFNHPNTVYKFDHQSTLFPCNTQLCPSYVSRIPLGVSFSNPCNFAQGAWQPHPQYKARYDEHGLHVAGKDPQPPWYLVQTNQICTFETLPVTHPITYQWCVKSKKENMCPESADEDKPSCNYPPAKNPDKTGKGETTSSVGWPLLANLGRIPQKRAKPDVSFPLHHLKGLVQGQLQSPKPNSQSARQPSSSSTGSTERDALRACRWSSLWARVVLPEQNDGLTTSNKSVEVREVQYVSWTWHNNSSEPPSFPSSRQL